MFDEPYTRSPLYVLGRIDATLGQIEDPVIYDVRATIVRMIDLLQKAESEIRDAAVSGYVDENIADRIGRFVRGEDEQQADGEEEQADG